MESNQLKIAIVVNTAWNIVNFRLGLIKALLNAGHEVVAIAPEDEYVSKIEAIGCRFIPLQTLERKGTNPIKDMRLVHELYRIYKNEKIDLALQYTIKPNIYGTFAASLAGIKTISTVTGLGYSFISTGWVSRIAKSLYKRAFRRSTLVAFQNNDDRKLFIDIGLTSKEKTILIKGSGIRTDYFIPMEKTEVNNNFVFLFVGRLLFDKGIQEFMEAAKKIHQNYPNAQFWIVGAIDEGNPSSVNQVLLDQYISEGFIKYFGPSDQVREMMRNCDVVVLPSYREGLPRVMLEALSMAIPVITTDAPGCRETVIDKKNGYMVPIKDVEALELAMEKMLNHSTEELLEMGQIGRAMALKEFDEQAIIQRYFEIIDSIFEQKKILLPKES